MNNFFQCCEQHTINFDLVCYSVRKDDAISVCFSNGKELVLKGKCKELVEQSLSMKSYYSKNI